MRFFADLHVHSRHARATARDLDLPHLALWAAKKGVLVLGTGDFTHPAWFDELRARLVPAEPGLFRLRPEFERWCAERFPPFAARPTRFLLQVETSTVFRQDGRGRRVHHLHGVPDFAAAGRFRARLAPFGNLAADGRPTLRLNSRDLLEITLEAGPGSFLIPAHIWTPWYAVLGSKSGFGSLAECYGDLAPEIFAVETGLSSDPPMNRRLTQLDGCTLVSGSDAHSPEKIGREATVFDCDLSFGSLREALRTGAGHAGTVEFFPEEGKYHLDGHRACGVRWEPAETRRLGGRCPVCGKALTVGVLHRVEALADRPAGEAAARAGAFRSFIPLRELLGEVLGVGPASRKVTDSYEQLLGGLGPELFILEAAPIEDIQRSGPPLLAEGIRRMRAGEVIREAGYDGEHGVIRVFREGELRPRQPGRAGPAARVADAEAQSSRTQRRALCSKRGRAPGGAAATGTRSASAA